MKIKLYINIYIFNLKIKKDIKNIINFEANFLLIKDIINYF